MTSMAKFRKPSYLYKKDRIFAVICDRFCAKNFLPRNMEDIFAQSDFTSFFLGEC